MASSSSSRRNTNMNMNIALLLLALLTASTSIQTVSATPSRLRRHPHQQQQLDDDEETAAIELPNTYTYDEPPPLTQQRPPTSDDEPTSLIAQQFSSNPYSTQDPLTMVLTGLATLSSIRITPTSFITDSLTTSNLHHVADSYNQVYGEFCVYERNLNKRHPAVYPTVDSVMATSNHCGEHRFSLDLMEVMEAVHRHDNNDASTASSSSSSSSKCTLPLSGMIFHEGYAGAGIISNTLSTFQNVRVISEHSALTDALSACDTIWNRYKVEDCVVEKERRLVMDVISLLSRTATPTRNGAASVEEEHLYLKLSASSTTYLPTLRTLYPNTPWLFVYRTNPDAALAKSLTGRRYTLCKKTKRNPSKTLLAKSTTSSTSSTSIEYHRSTNTNNGGGSIQSLEQMSPVQVCAMHLSTLIDVATQEYNDNEGGLLNNNMGMLVQYDQVFTEKKVAVEMLLTSILPFLGLHYDYDELLVSNTSSEQQQQVEIYLDLHPQVRSRP